MLMINGRIGTRTQFSRIVPNSVKNAWIKRNYPETDVTFSTGNPYTSDGEYTPKPTRGVLFSASTRPSAEVEDCWGSKSPSWITAAPRQESRFPGGAGLQASHRLTSAILQGGRTREGFSWKPCEAASGGHGY